MKPVFPPRNPFAIAAKKRKAGTHQKPEKTRRHAEKLVLRKQLRQGLIEGQDPLVRLRKTEGAA